MQQQYFEVPNNILTGKDLDYLSDMFEWNYGALKKANNALEQVTSEDLVEVFQKAVNLFDNNLNIVLNILQSAGGEENEQQ